jgi:UDP-glucose 4-epimerase
MTQVDSWLVTGAAGFIGSHVVRRLLEHTNLDIVALDDLSGGFRDYLPDHQRLTFAEGSVTDEKLVKGIFERHKFRYVYHLATYAAEGLSHFIRRFNYENNVIGSINIINAAVNNAVETLVFTSSIAVYGVAKCQCSKTWFRFRKTPMALRSSPSN